MKARFLIFGLVLGLAAVAVGWVYESRLRERVEPRELVIPDNIDYFLTDMNLRAMSDEGELDYTLDSPRLEHYPHNDVSQIETPRLKIFRESDLWRVTSLHGEFEHRDNLLRLQRQVVMKKSGPDALELFTESIRFEPDRDLVTTEASVTMLSKESRIDAEKAEFDLAGKIYRFDEAKALYHDQES